MSFGELPVEIQCSVIRILDPVALIAISQTNRQFRHIVSPGKKHFCERLLALESLPEHGGAAPVFMPGGNKLMEELPRDAWDGMRWACSGCLRLLPCQNFENHYILRLAYRKPIPGSPAADMITSWEPSAHRQHSHIHHPRKADYKENMFRIRFIRSVTLADATVPDHELLSYRGEVPSRLDYERANCGYSRRLRKCNECRYLSNELKPRMNEIGEIRGGTASVPIINTLQLSFGSTLDRYFPGISNILKNKRPSFDPPLFRVYRENARGDLWAMRMIRCPTCTRWQELREFRFGGSYEQWAPTIGTHQSQTWDGMDMTESLVDNLSCNECYAKEHGHQQLLTVLLKWFHIIMDNAISGVTGMLGFGYSVLRNQYPTGFPKKHQVEVKEILARVSKVMSTPGTFNSADLETLKLYRERALELLSYIDGNDWMKIWELHFDEMEAWWKWLVACRDEVNRKPDALAEWVLSRDGTALR